MFFPFFVQLLKGSAQHFVALGLACPGRSHQHHSMSYIHGFIQFEDLVEEVRHYL